MTLPTFVPASHIDDDSDMFGPPNSSSTSSSSTTLSSSSSSSLTSGHHNQQQHHHHHHRSRVPMISPKLRLREERKRILQLCAHKLERIKDSETNLRRSVCINNTYSRLTDELRREKQNRYLVNSSKSKVKSSEISHENIFSFTNATEQQNMDLCNDYFHHHNHKGNYNSHVDLQQQQQQQQHRTSNSLPKAIKTSFTPLDSIKEIPNSFQNQESNSCSLTAAATTTQTTLSSSSCTTNSSCKLLTSTTTAATTTTTLSLSSSYTSSNNLDTDLEILDRELSAINASMPLIDPEITQGAEQLEKAISSRKRLRSNSCSDDENDRLVREALSQLYIPTQRLISGIDDYPQFDMKRTKLSTNNLNMNMNINNNVNSNNNCNLLNYNNYTNNSNNLMVSTSSTDFDLELNFDYNQTQKDFEVIIDALRLGTTNTSPTPTPGATDSCGQAAMLSETGVFHNLVVASLET